MNIVKFMYSSPGLCIDRWKHSSPAGPTEYETLTRLLAGVFLFGAWKMYQEYKAEDSVYNKLPVTLVLVIYF